MKTTCLTYILAILMFAQSALALTDMHALLQPEKQHSAPIHSVAQGQDTEAHRTHSSAMADEVPQHAQGHEHNSHSDSSSIDSSLASDAELDCQHCCHCLCNCSANSILPNTALALSSLCPLSEATPYCVSKVPVLINPLLRPPIFS